jgi:hypothetical protein
MKIKVLAAFSIILFSNIALAAFLEDEWEGDIHRYCKYSDGTVIKIAFVALCPLSI